MKQKIYKLRIYLFGSPKERHFSRLDWIRMFMRSRYRLFVYKKIFWDHCKQNLHPCFLIDHEFVLTSTEKQKFHYLTRLYTRREIAHRKATGEEYPWLLKNKVIYLTTQEIVFLPSC